MITPTAEPAALTKSSSGLEVVEAVCASAIEAVDKVKRVERRSRYIIAIG